MPIVLELDRIVTVTAELVLAGTCCDGCNVGFCEDGQLAIMVERFRHRSYAIHICCETTLLHRLEGEADA